MVNLTNIVLGIVVLVVLYVVYIYFFQSSRVTLLNQHDARQIQVIQPSSLPTGTNADYTYSVWIYISNWNYRFGETKVIFGRTDQNNQPAPSLTLAPSENNLHCTVETYPSSGTDANQGTTHTCSIQNIPIQKWTNIIVTLNNRTLDMYLDGKLVRTCVLPGVPKVSSSSPVSVTPNGGFSGYVSNFQYLAKSVNPNEAYSIYKEGNGGASYLSSLFNKYRLKFAFVEDNKEINSFEI